MAAIQDTVRCENPGQLLPPANAWDHRNRLTSAERWHIDIIWQMADLLPQAGPTVPPSNIPVAKLVHLMLLRNTMQ